MPQTEVKHEFFAPFAVKVLSILGIARKAILWISLCIDFLHRINPGHPKFNVTILIMFFMMLSTIVTTIHIIGDNLCRVDITNSYFSILVGPVFRADF
jgi:hypothetical protein